MYNIFENKPNKHGNMIDFVIKGKFRFENKVNNFNEFIPFKVNFAYHPHLLKIKNYKN